MGKKEKELPMAKLQMTAERQLFAVLTAEVGSGKNTAIRKFDSILDKFRFILFYKVRYLLLSDRGKKNFVDFSVLKLKMFLDKSDGIILSITFISVV